MTSLRAPEEVRTRSPRTEDPAGRCIDRTVACLRREQRDGDHWVGTLSSSALATAMSIVALHLAGAARYAQEIDRGRRWLLATQAADGGWGDAVVDESNINATSLAIGALTLTAGQTKDEGRRTNGLGSGDSSSVFRPSSLATSNHRTPGIPGDNAGGWDAAGAALARAHERLERFGGLAAVGDPARCTLSGPCRTVAALAGLMDWRRIKRLRPEVILLPARVRRTISTTFPAYLSIAMLHAAMAPHPLNRLPTYGLARRRAMAWLGRAQGANGSFEESAFLSSVIVMGMTASGHGDLPWLRDALRFIVASQRADGGWPIDRDLETFDTAMAVFALREAGVEVPQAAQVCHWLLARQFAETCFATEAAPGGWSWAMPAGWPDTDDTSYAMVALAQLGVPPAEAPLRRGARWLRGMQNSNGSWSTFVRNSAMPFDHDCPYVTGHVLSALAAVRELRTQPRTLERALAYLAGAQRYDGSFASIWFREATAGTASVLEALADCGLVESPMAVRARVALLRSQNDDGGWAGLRGQPSTAEETSWALLALLRCPPSGASQTLRAAISRGTAWLVTHQREDGTWEPAPIGLYYSAMWYSDSYYAVALPLQALARATARAAPPGATNGAANGHAPA